MSLAGAGGLLLTGCAFRPLYGTTASGQRLQDALKAVEIAPIPGRVGQRIRNELIFNTAQGGNAATPIYRLDVAIRESETAVLVEVTGDAQGQIYVIGANFKLVSLKDNKVVFKGQSNTRAAYDKSFERAADGKQVNSLFSNTRARVDAENRAARTLADEIKTRIATYLATA
jgi:LPS-assembly lipoprotein